MKKSMFLAVVVLFNGILGDLSRYEEYDYDYDQSIDDPASNEIQDSKSNLAGRSEKKSFNPKGDIDFTGKIQYKIW